MPKQYYEKNDLGVDCISRKQAILTIQRYGVGCFDADEFSPEECERFVIAKLNELDSVTPQVPRWIPVSDYLPVTNDEVLVTYIVNGNHKKRYVEVARCFDGEWSSVNGEYRIPNTRIEILAWQELPKPYKAESENT